MTRAMILATTFLRIWKESSETYPSLLGKRHLKLFNHGESIEKSPFLAMASCFLVPDLAEDTFTPWRSSGVEKQVPCVLIASKRFSD